MLELKHLPGDTLKIVKAVVSNQVAKFLPRVYVNLTAQTGRGSEVESAVEIAQYFLQCFQDYQVQLGIPEQSFKAYLQGKTVLEYGPGDILGVALLLYAHGADRVDCVDRFELSKLSRKNILVYTEILKLLAPKERERAERAFNEVGNPESGFKVNAIQYKITKNGLSSDGESYDLVISRAVLEHVNDLESTILDIKKVLKTGGTSIHQVDLKSHGLDRRADLDFLTWNSFLYRQMYSHKGFPNRWRVNKYREFASKAKLQIERMAATEQLGDEKVKRILPRVAKEFTKTSAEDLSWLGFWIVFKG